MTISMGSEILFSTVQSIEMSSPGSISTPVGSHSMESLSANADALVRLRSSLNEVILLLILSLLVLSYSWYLSIFDRCCHQSAAYHAARYLFTGCCRHVPLVLVHLPLGAKRRKIALSSMKEKYYHQEQEPLY